MNFFFLFRAGKEFIEKAYICKLCKSYVPLNGNFKRWLNGHFCSRLHIQKYEQYCNKNEFKVKINEKIKKESVEETNSDSDSSNKV